MSFDLKITSSDLSLRIFKISFAAVSPMVMMKMTMKMNVLQMKMLKMEMLKLIKMILKKDDAEDDGEG